MRAKLIGPMLEQNEKVGELYRRRAWVTDVEPESGDVTECRIPTRLDKRG